MSPIYARTIAVVIAAVFIAIATRRVTSWPWYAVAAIILAGCVYSYVKPQHWFVRWTTS